MWSAERRRADFSVSAKVTHATGPDQRVRHARAELRDGAMKAVTREYYYIDFRRAIDVTKYRLFMLHEKNRENNRQSQDKKELVCPRCKSEWTIMEVLDMVDPACRSSGFLCRTCEHPLDSINANGSAEHDSDDSPAKLNKQLRPLEDLMRRIDQVSIPPSSGEEAVANSIDIPRDKDINPVAKHEPVPAGAARPAAVKGLATAPEKVEVSIATEKEYSNAAHVERTAQRAKLAQQNALPAWHTKSTITDAEYHPTTGTAKVAANGTQASPSDPASPDAAGPNGNPALDAYFAALKEEQARQTEEDDEEDLDEDADDFEDVVVAAPAVSASPSKRPKLASPAAPSWQSKEAASPLKVAASLDKAEEESEENDEFEDAI